MSTPPLLFAVSSSSSHRLSPLSLEFQLLWLPLVSSFQPLSLQTITFFPFALGSTHLTSLLFSHHLKILSLASSHLPPPKSHLCSVSEPFPSLFPTKRGDINSTLKLFIFNCSFQAQYFYFIFHSLGAVKQYNSCFFLCNVTINWHMHLHFVYLSL